MSVKRVALAASAVFLLAAPVMAGGTGGYYIEGYGGVAFSGDLEVDGSEYEMDTGFNFGGAIGKQITPNVAMELDVFYAELGYAGYDANISGLGIMADGIYSFNPDGFADPYLGAGAGMVRVHFEEGGDSDEDWKFGYQLMGGLMLNVSKGFGVFAEYRFQDAVGDAEIESSDLEYQSHNVSGGIRARF